MHIPFGFTWEPVKDLINQKKHGIPFTQAVYCQCKLSVKKFLKF